MSYKFTGVIILEGEDLGAKKVNERRPEDQKGGSHAATVPGRLGPPFWSYGLRPLTSFAPKSSPSKIMTPLNL